jgi:hypothetical protein
MPQPAPSPPSRRTAVPPQAAPPLPTTPAPRGNPNLANTSRCGARTRAGCLCRAPAIRGKLRCPAGQARGQAPHGGRSTSPRTAEGLARLRAARTTHGGDSAESRAFNRHIISLLRRGRLKLDAHRLRHALPPGLAARLAQLPPELQPPPWPSGGLFAAQDRAVLRAEAEALAPWRQAVALARQGGASAAARAPAAVPPPAAAAEASPTAPAIPHAPEAQPAAAAARQAPPPTPPAIAAAPPAGAHAPEMAGSASATRAGGQAEAHAPERPAARPAPTGGSPPATARSAAKPHAPERTCSPAAAARLSAARGATPMHQNSGARPTARHPHRQPARRRAWRDPMHQNPRARRLVAECAGRQCSGADCHQGCWRVPASARGTSPAPCTACDDRAGETVGGRAKPDHDTGGERRRRRTARPRAAASAPPAPAVHPRTNRPRRPRLAATHRPATMPPRTGEAAG